MNVLSAPGSLWELYVEYLWRYQPGSWVASTASTFRILALITMMPFIILTLLDVTSYVIARTLGVIDHTKASTSGSGSEDPSIPTVAIHDDESDTTPTPPLFRSSTEEEGNLKLSGVGMFSPLPSEPPSPTISRRELSHYMHPAHSRKDAADDPVLSTQHSRESFPMLDRESSPDEALSTLRRRPHARDDGPEGS